MLVQHEGRAQCAERHDRRAWPACACRADWPRTRRSSRHGSIRMLPQRHQGSVVAPNTPMTAWLRKDEQRRRAEHEPVRPFRTLRRRPQPPVGGWLVDPVDDVVQPAQVVVDQHHSFGPGVDNPFSGQIREPGSSSLASPFSSPGWFLAQHDGQYRCRRAAGRVPGAGSSSTLRRSGSPGCRSRACRAVERRTRTPTNGRGRTRRRGSSEDAQQRPRRNRAGRGTRVEDRDELLTLEAVSVDGGVVLAHVHVVAASRGSVRPSAPTRV